MGSFSSTVQPRLSELIKALVSSGYRIVLNTGLQIKNLMVIKIIYSKDL
jgi:hypothetical protein